MEGLKFSISLEDFVSPSSKKASAALHALQTSLKTTKAQLASYQAQLTRANSLGDVAGHAKYAALVEESKKSVYGLTQQLENAGPAAKGFGSSLSISSAGLADVVRYSLEAEGAILAVTAAIGALAIKTALDVTAVNERLVKTFDALGAQGAGSGKSTLEFLDKLSTKLPQTRDQLATWTKQYEALGITDLGQLRHQILATASAQAIMGDEGANAYTKITERVNLAVEAHHGLKLAEKSLKSLYEAGVNETDIAQKMGITVQALGAGLKAGTIDAQAFGNALSDTLVRKGKGPLEAMGSELGTLEAKASETFRHFFDGIDTKPLTDALKSVIRLGDQGNPSGKALASGVKGGLNEIFVELGHGVTEAEVFFLTLELYALETGITAKGAIKGVEAGVRSLVFVAETLVLPFTAALHAAEALYGLVDSHTGKVEGGTKIGALGGGGSLLGPGIAKAPANANGGLVAKPASGEMFASVAPGESILPARQTRQIAEMGKGSAAALARPQNDNGGGGVHVDRVEVNITAPHGVTGAKELSVTGLTIALERIRLAAGR